MLLLRTIGGSRLYGLSHENSDWDWFEVYGYKKGRATQKIVGREDKNAITFDRFMRYCEKGVPQHLEAMFSRVAEVDNMPFNRMKYGINRRNVRDTYLRTIKQFWLVGIEEDDFKRRRHAVRLMINLNSMEESGMFNPTLSPQQIAVVNEIATRKTLPEILR
jgi:hypothetical protein